MRRRDNDIKAPDGYLLGGYRLVRADGTLLFHRIYWDCPKEWIGEHVLVHVTDGMTLNTIEAAPPDKSLWSKDTIIIEPADKPEAKQRTWYSGVQLEEIARLSKGGA